MKNKIEFDNMKISYEYTSKTGGADSTYSANCYDGGEDDGGDSSDGDNDGWCDCDDGGSDEK